MFWACAQLWPQRAGLALHCLREQHFEVYYPRLRGSRMVRGRKITTQLGLFPGYCFVLIRLQWHSIRGTPGIIRLVLDGERPAQVPDAVIAEIRSRERNGLIELPTPVEFQPGDKVCIVHGALAGRLAIYAGMRPRERVAVLLGLLGSESRVELARNAIEAV